MALDILTFLALVFILTALLTVLSMVFWAAFWAVSRRMHERDITRWFEKRKSQGEIASFGRLSTDGFPYFLNTFVYDLANSSSLCHALLRTPKLEVYRRARRPSRLLFSTSSDHRLVTPWGNFTVTQKISEARVQFVPFISFLRVFKKFLQFSDDLCLKTESGVEIECVELQFILERAKFLFRRQYELILRLHTLKVPEPYKRHMGNSKELPDYLENVFINATVTPNPEWVRRPFGDYVPKISKITFMRSNCFTWGDSMFSIQGQLFFNEFGQPNGELTVLVDKWQPLWEVLRSSELLPKRIFDPLDKEINRIEEYSGGEGLIRFGVKFWNGKVKVGNVLLSSLGVGPLMLPNLVRRPKEDLDLGKDKE